MDVRRGLLSLLIGCASGWVAYAQTPDLPAPTPVEPVTALITAFRSHDLVTLSEPHGNEHLQALLLSLVRDPRFPDSVQDIVLETASARYQDVLDRYVRGDVVSADDLRHVWEDAVSPTSLGVHAQPLITAVRAVNATRPTGKQVRVLAGDPPIDWAHVVTANDHRRWVELRDTYPADLIRRQVLDRGRRALVVYGQGHLQRAMIDTNYDTGPWQAQTLMSLVTRDPQVRVFNVFALLRDGAFLPEIVSSWPAPSMALVRGTSLGTRDFGTLQAPLGGTRVALRGNQVVPIPPEQWIVMPLERQFDAVLYLGPPRSFTVAPVPVALCRDAQALAQRLERLRFVPPIEAQRLRQACEAGK